MDDLISRRMITAHLKQRLWETALNNVGIKCDADEIYSDIADNRLDSWMNELCIKEIPSAQPEIVRCKDCKHSEFWYRDKRRCFLWHEEGIDVFEDGFCNYAERRTDG